MSAEPVSRFHPHALAAVILVAALLATWCAYAPGMGGSLHFDDKHNLQGLATVHDAESAFHFVASGIAGPLGRPLALASFVPEAHAWPDLTEVFLRTNILIHMLNGILVIWFLYLLGCARKQPEQQAALIAAGAGAIWMLMPILASSSLFIVQRMTTLSATFMLFGAVAYMYARQLTSYRPSVALLWMTLAAGTGAILAVLTKENGAILFLFILAVEATLLTRPPTVSRGLWRTWFGVVLLGPLALLSVYLVSVLQYSDAMILMRDFNGYERLLTQAGVLWKYLYLTFLPNIPSLGPFHDEIRVQRSLASPFALLSVAGWIVVIAAAYLSRRKAPLFTFAVAWYLLGHLLESTTASLELYFEHRNYLPIVGPVYALIASLHQLGSRWRRLAGIAATAYAGLLAAILYSTTSLWGTPAIASEMWHVYKPASMRAVQYLDDKLQRDGDPYSARRLLNRFIDDNPEAHGIHLQVLLISCQLEPESDHSEALQFLEEKLPEAKFNFSIVASLQLLHRFINEGRCPSIDRSALYTLGQSLLKNPRFNSPTAIHNVHGVLASIGIEEGDYLGMAMLHLRAALKAYQHPDTLLYAIGVLNRAGQYDLSWQLLAEAKAQQPPLHPLRALQRERDLDRIEAILRDSDESRSGPQ